MSSPNAVNPRAERARIRWTRVNELLGNWSVRPWWLGERWGWEEATRPDGTHSRNILLEHCLFRSICMSETCTRNPHTCITSSATHLTGNRHGGGANGSGGCEGWGAAIDIDSVTRRGWKIAWVVINCLHDSAVLVRSSHVNVPERFSLRVSIRVRAESRTFRRNGNVSLTTFFVYPLNWSRANRFRSFSGNAVSWRCDGRPNLLAPTAGEQNHVAVCVEDDN